MVFVVLVNIFILNPKSESVLNVMNIFGLVLGEHEKAFASGHASQGVRNKIEYWCWVCKKEALKKKSVHLNERECFLYNNYFIYFEIY